MENISEQSASPLTPRAANSRDNRRFFLMFKVPRRSARQLLAENGSVAQLSFHTSYVQEIKDKF